MLDGLGMAETTPGPLIMVTQFVGFLAACRDPGGLPPLLAATLGGLLTTWVTFVPCFLWIFFGAPFVEALRSNKALSAALGAVTAAVVGVILNLAVWFALHVLFAELVPMQWLGASVDVPVLKSVDMPSLVLSLTAAVAIFRFKIGMLPVLLACSLAGVIILSGSWAVDVGGASAGEAWLTQASSRSSSSRPFSAPWSPDWQASPSGWSPQRSGCTS